MKPSRGLMAPQPIISQSHCCHSVKVTEPLTFDPSVLAPVRSTNRPPCGSTSFTAPIRLPLFASRSMPYQLPSRDPSRPLDSVEHSVEATTPLRNPGED